MQRENILYMAAADICLEGEKNQQVVGQNCVSIKIAAGLLQFSRDILKGCLPDRRSGATWSQGTSVGTQQTTGC